MNDLSLELRNGQAAYRPGEQITGRARWWFDKSPRQIEIQLLWSTRGKGEVDQKIVDSIILEAPADRGDHAFSFNLPQTPHSFSGKLISLQWSVKAIATKPIQEAQVNIIVSPSLREISLSGSQD
jgi:hypothetical protein